MFDELYINDYCNFNTFKMVFPREKTTPGCVNLNLIVGKNGSGKSSLLDALFEIGEYNLKDNIQQIDNTRFEYKILKNNKIISSNIGNAKNEKMSKEEQDKYLWDSVIRLHTGHTPRQSYSYKANIYSLTTYTTKWALLAYITSGVWQHKEAEDTDLWNELQNVIFGKNNHIEPKIIWVDIQKNKNYDDIGEVIRDIRKPDSSIYIGNNITRYFWNLETPIIIEPLGTGIRQEKINPLPLLAALLYKSDPIIISNDINGKYIDTGFLYMQGESGKLYPDSFLSDGEHGFITRFALLMLLREENKNNDKHYLILLDEPETHFNENWKSSFLNLVCKIFKNTNQDIFIATHSAMLVTDAKENEIHRLENLPSGIIHYPVPIKTYGANIVDIGQALFGLEADIGERSKNNIEAALKGVKEIKEVEAEEEPISLSKQKEKLKKLLKQVGPGEWRWRIRSKINQLEKADSCCNFSPKKVGNDDSTRSN